MPHNDLGFNNLTFTDNLQNVDIDSLGLQQPTPNDVLLELRSLSDGNTHFALDTLESLMGGRAKVDEFFQQFSRAGTRLPLDWQDFLVAIQNFVSSGTSQAMSQTEEAFEKEFRDILGIGGAKGDPVGGDWEALSSEVSSFKLLDIFKKSFSHFLKNYPYPEVPPADQTVQSAPANQQVTTNDFFDNWYQYMAVTAHIEKEPSSITSSNAFASYKRVYDGFGLPANEFESRLIEFYNEQIEETRTNAEPNPPNGFFIPSQAFGKWFEQMQEDFSISLSGTASPVFTSVTTESSKRVIILDRIFRLLVEMIDILQKLASAQASRLSFLTQWQKAYVDSMNQVRTFVWQGKSAIGGGDQSGGDRAGVRQELNRVNSTYTEQLRANRSLISDDAKALQSNVNQSNDAVTQQSDLAQAIIRQFQTILGSIFR